MHGNLFRWEKVKGIMNHNFQFDILSSWKAKEGNVNSNQELLAWIENLNFTTHVDIKECSINDSTFWFYDDYKGEILNRKRSFFSVIGMRYFENNIYINEQPIIIQPEIGYLGIICKKIDGILNFLMQGKIEPGNINCVQISPTLQATKSNFTRTHGGRLPDYFEYFENSSKYCVVYDQVQSEQASRFYKKRNRNMIMLVEEEIQELPNYKWMTLGQIKNLMKHDNIVNMDTRTVLSGLPIATVDKERAASYKIFFDDETLYNSIYLSDCDQELPEIFQKVNDHKMFKDITIASVPLNQLMDWKVNEYGITCLKPANFCVRYYDIEISGREVQNWVQPLFKAVGSAIFALFTKIVRGKRKYLLQLKPEIGSFDCIELGPTIQWEPTHTVCSDNVERCFVRHLNMESGILLDVMLSEEGGRFYHEQNRNLILQIEDDELKVIPDNYFWVDYGTLMQLVRMNNCLNIQLRNLVALIDL